MDANQELKFLRLQLLDMTRATQRVVDCSTKVHGPGGADFFAAARTATFEIDMLCREIKELTGSLPLTDLPDETEVHFVLSTTCICDVLRNIRLHAIEIATDSMRLLKDGWKPEYANLVRIGEAVNCQMRLCVVALFEQEVRHADTVLHSHTVGNLFAAAFGDRYLTLDSRAGTDRSCELSITRHLSQMAKEISKLSYAIALCLEGTDSVKVMISDSDLARGVVKTRETRMIS